jgi:hypothetical protein
MGSAGGEPVLNGLHGLCRQFYPLPFPPALAEDGKALLLLIEVHQVKGDELSTPQTLRPENAQDGAIPRGHTPFLLACIVEDGAEALKPWPFGVPVLLRTDGRNLQNPIDPPDDSGKLYQGTNGRQAPIARNRRSPY